jgi:hypothetical protein
MKKILILIAFLLQYTVSFSQSEWSEYGSWSSGNCFPQLMSRIKTVSNPKINTTGVMVEFKNNYSRKVTFMFKGFNNSAEAKQVFADKGNLLGGQQSSISLGPGQTVTHTFDIKGAGSKTAYIEIYTLYFDNDYQHYQKCSDGTVCLYCQINSDNEPACPNYSKNKAQTTTQQNNVDENNSINAGIESQKQNKIIEIANKNAEAQRQQQLLKQQQEQQRQKQQEEAINNIGNVVSNSAISITNAGLANLVRQTEIENEVKNILKGRESLYPDATKYFDVYLKEKRKRKTGNWIGIGVMIGGTVAAGAGALSGGEYDINYPLVYGGIGGVLVGLFKTITTLSVGKKGNDALQNAKKSLTLGTASSGLGMSIKF